MKRERREGKKRKRQKRKREEKKKREEKERRREKKREETKREKELDNEGDLNQYQIQQMVEELEATIKILSPFHLWGITKREKEEKVFIKEMVEREERREEKRREEKRRREKTFNKSSNHLCINWDTFKNNCSLNLKCFLW